MAGAETWGRLVRWVLYGASGFVGSAIAAALPPDATLVPRPAPRLLQTSPELANITRNARRRAERIADDLRDGDIVINAAGLAAPGQAMTPAILGANALLPATLSFASASARAARFIHISSAAVQGRTTLDSRARWEPESAYAQSKALAEQAILELNPHQSVIHRATSVQGPGRRVTASLQRLARSPIQSVTAAPGNAPTPQVHVSQLVEAVRVLVTADNPPKITLQPNEGFTTYTFLRLLGGRPPRLVPTPLARLAVSAGLTCSTRARSSLMWSTARRAEMLLFGQAQESGWLDENAPQLTVRHQDWKHLAV